MYGQELLNKINTMLENPKMQELEENYKLKKQILENKGYTLHPVINHKDMTLASYPVWVMTKNMDLYEFKSNINYWTGERNEEDKTTKLSNKDFEIEVLDTLEIEGLKIDYIISTYKDSKEFYYRITTGDNKVFQMDYYYNYFNIKGLKGIRKIKNAIDEAIDDIEEIRDHHRYIIIVESGQY